MRDIRPDLIERLSGFREERLKLTARLREIDSEEAPLKVLLEAENRRFPTEVDVTVDSLTLEEPSDIAARHFAATSDLRRIVLEVMSDRNPRSRSEITKVVEERGVQTAGAPGRSVQGTLLSLKHQGVVRALDEGIWQLIK